MKKEFNLFYYLCPKSTFLLLFLGQFSEAAEDPAGWKDASCRDYVSLFYQRSRRPMFPPRAAFDFPHCRAVPSASRPSRRRARAVSHTRSGLGVTGCFSRVNRRHLYRRYRQHRAPPQSKRSGRRREGSQRRVPPAQGCSRGARGPGGSAEQPGKS